MNAELDSSVESRGEQVRGNDAKSHLQVTRRGGDRPRYVWIEKSTAAATSEQTVDNTPDSHQTACPCNNTVFVPHHRHPNHLYRVF